MHNIYLKTHLIIYNSSIMIAQQWQTCIVYELYVDTCVARLQTC